MSIAVWPPSLPQTPLQDGYSEQAPNNLLRSESESGVVKVRRKGANKPSVMQGSFIFTHEQRLVFKDFVQNTLMDGALRFSFNHPIDEVDIEVRLVPADDGLYTLTPWGQYYKTLLKLEILP